MCSAIVRFVVARDPAGRFRFAALGSGAGAAILARAGGAPAADTFLLARGDRVYMKSSAGLEVVRRLSGAWPLLYMLIVVPAPIRDAVYDYIARNRYRWFGRSDSCTLPPPAIKERFIE